MRLDRNFILWMSFLLVMGFLISSAQMSAERSVQGPMREVSYTELMSAIDEGSIVRAEVSSREVLAQTQDGRNIRAFVANPSSTADAIVKKGGEVRIVPPAQPSLLLGVLLNALPLILLLVVGYIVMRRISNAAGGRAGPFSFAKSRAKLMAPENVKVTFEDVAGVDEAKEELSELVDFLKDPSKFLEVGGAIPKGVLLCGPPGTGKTLLAKAVAGEANVPFFSTSGSEFVEMFVGVGAGRVRDMFAEARKVAPCIVFIDEIDAVGRQRGAGLGGGNDEREQTLNQILVEMDGFGSDKPVIVIAATNRPDVLDPALTRPGRFDRQVVVANPDVKGRSKILSIHMRKIRYAPDVVPDIIARGTPGFSGADLENLVNEAALIAVRRGRKLATMEDFELAKDKVLMGPERRSLAMTEREKELTAYHEAGHAVVGLVIDGSDPLHKVTIVPRGRALGVTMYLPEKDHTNLSQKQIEARLAMIYGGRVAEEIIYGPENVTTGASNDLMQAARLARAMVTEYGMSEKLGRLRYAGNEEDVFLGRSIQRQQNVSEHTARLIDEEVRRICVNAEMTAKKALLDNKPGFEALAQALIERETLSGEEAREIIMTAKA